MSEGLPGIPGSGPQGIPGGGPQGIPGGGPQGIPGALPLGVSFDKPALPGPPPAAAPGPTYELSNWGRRAVAALIDGFVVSAIATAVVFVFAAVIGVALFSAERDASSRSGGEFGHFFGFMVALLGVAVALMIVAMLYAPIWMAQTNGRTLGKQMLGIRVVRADGVPMTFGFAVFREVLIKGLLTGFLAGVTVYLYALADIFWPLWDSEHRALHDHLAKTRVIRD